MHKSITYFDPGVIDTTLHLVEQYQNKEVTVKTIPWLKNAYFVGAGLCLDVNTPWGLEVLTFSHSDESVGLFSGGMRRLLSLKSMRSLERIMANSGIHFKPRWT